MKFLFYFSVFYTAFALPLDDYINKVDNHYTWYNTNVILEGRALNLHKWSGYCLNMTSQKWLTENDSSSSIWTHHLVIINPENIEIKDTGILFIGGGDNTYDIPTAKDDHIILAAELATNTKSTVAILYQIPNQPIVFKEDSLQKSRTEDAVVAFTWDHFLRNPNNSNEWPIRLPMTKAAVRAMDTVQEFTDHRIDKFVVAGASKRGWATYFVGAIDKRVIAIIPIVMDMLNMIPSIHHMYKAYGGWTFAFKDYWKLGILGKIDSKEMLKLAEIEDPISYVDRYTMPKLIVNAANDEFFMGDDINYWWDKLSEPKNRLFIQNADHSLVTGIQEAVPSISKWINRLYNNEKNISILWKFDDDYIIAETSETPSKVSLWYAKTCNNKRRDFRIFNLDNPCTCGLKYDKYCTNLRVLWNRKDIKITNNNYWNETIEEDKNKWTAFFLEFNYDGLDLTTGLNIIPNTFPYEDCCGESCNGVLV